MRSEIFSGIRGGKRGSRAATRRAAPGGRGIGSGTVWKRAGDESARASAPARRDRRNIYLSLRFARGCGFDLRPANGITRRAVPPCALARARARARRRISDIIIERPIRTRANSRPLPPPLTVSAAAAET